MALGHHHIVDHERPRLDPSHPTGCHPRLGLKPRRLLGLGLLLGAYLPVHRLLDAEQAGPAGSATRASAEAAWGAGLYGTLIVLGSAFVMSRLVGLGRLRAQGTRLLQLIERPTSGSFALLTGGFSLLLTAAVARFLYDGSPTSVDELAQLLHASALADGRLGIPLLGDQAAWLVQNGTATTEGWASVYPPFHTMLLAIGIRVGAPWIVGPLAIATATVLSTLCFERLLGTWVGRLAGLMLGLSPFWISIGATHLSHTTAAAALAATLWAALHAQGGSVPWAFATGAALGAAVTTRPWVGLVAGATLVAASLASEAFNSSRKSLGPRFAAFVGGGLPFAVLLFWWNARLFGHPLRLGYSATFGPAHGLGLHVDPWGNRYGVLQALAYTGADLVQLGLHLFETPLPAVAMVGVALMLGLVRGRTGVLIAWTAAVSGANALYWHHGIHMGPRMVYEAVPAWVGLFVLAAVEIGRGNGLPQRIRSVAAWSVLLTVLGGGILIPGVLIARGANVGSAPDIELPPPGVPAIVFVHGSWSSRIASRLAATGMRRDSIETALRRNGICAVNRYARWRADPSPQAGSEAPQLELSALPGSPLTLEPRLLSPGNVIRVDSAVPFDATCSREARADRFGAIELESLIWRFPPLSGRTVFVARDLGPTTNLTVRRTLARRAFVLIDGLEGDTPRLLEFDEGMELLWGGAASASTGGG